MEESHQKVIEELQKKYQREGTGRNCRRIRETAGGRDRSHYSWFSRDDKWLGEDVSGHSIAECHHLQGSDHIYAV